MPICGATGWRDATNLWVPLATTAQAFDSAARTSASVATPSRAEPSPLLLDAQAGDGSADHQLLDLLGAFEDRE